MHTLYRLLVINFTLARFGLDEIILSMHFYRPLRLLGLINPFNWFRSSALSEGERLRLCIESLGPIFIKFGQMLATRRDLLPDDIVDELEKLLDQVPPFPLQCHQFHPGPIWTRPNNPVDAFLSSATAARFNQPI